MSEPPVVLIVRRAKRADDLSDKCGYFVGEVDGWRWRAVSRSPFLDAARALLAAGCATDRAYVMRHAGSPVDCLISTIGAAAGLAIREGEGLPRFRPWMPRNPGPGGPPMR